MKGESKEIWKNEEISLRIENFQETYLSLFIYCVMDAVENK